MYMSWTLSVSWAILDLPSRKMSSVVAGEVESLTEAHNSKASYFHDIFHSFQVFSVFL